MEFSLRRETKNTEKKSRLNGAQRLKECGFILILLAAAFMMVALLTFDSADPSWSQTAWKGPVENAAGSFGAWMADTLFFTFGTLAYPFPPALVLGGWVFLRRRGESEPLNYTILASRILGLLLLFLTSCALADLNFDDFWHFSSGGVIGDVITSISLPLFNVLGSTLVMLFVWAAGFTLFTGISWLTIVDRLGEYTLSGLTWLVNRIRGDKTHRIGGSKQEYGDETDDELTDVKAFSQPQRKLVSAETETHRHKVEPTLAPPAIIFGGQHDDENNLAENQLEEQKVASESKTESDTSSSTEQFSAQSVSELDNSTLLENDDEQVTEGQQGFAEPKSDDVDEVPWQEAESVDDANEVTIAPAPEPRFNSSEATQEQEQAEQTLSVAETEYGNADGLSELERAERESGISDDDENAFLETIREAQKNAAAATHPFLIKDEPNLPKPEEPLPTLDLLDPAKKTAQQATREELEQTARLVEARLEDYKIQARVVGVYPGPVITRFELDLAPGVKVSRISGLSKDLARSLSTSAVRVVEVIPGKPYIGLELPNATRETVFMSEVVGSERFERSRSPLSVVLGKDIAGEAIVTDLAKSPHLLVAGTTGSGKSVGVNVMIVSMLYKASPEDVRFIMIDPKMLELSVYEGIPHLLTEVVTDMKDAGNALRWCVAEMERRYKLMSALGVRNIAGFNDKVREANAAQHPIPDPLWKPGDSMDETAPVLEKLPYIVVIVDEFADLMMVVGKKVEELIARLAQKARAAGIHLVLATQRPSVDVITGLIKANIPTRMAFTVSTKTDSRTILDQGGAESLLGMGDMLFMPNGSNHPVRVHGAFVNDDEVHRVVNNWKARGKPQYVSEITNGDQGSDALLPGESPVGADGEELDQLFDQVVEFVTESRRGSVSGVQRRFKIGYNRAARIVEQLEAHGVVSPPGHNGNREVLAPPPPPRD